VNELNLPTRTLANPIGVRIRDSSLTYCRDRVVLPLKNLDDIYPVEAYVSRELPFDLILGGSFLEQFNAIIDYPNKQISLDIDATPPPPPDVQDTVYLLQDAYIPARSEAILEVRCATTPMSSEISPAFVRTYRPLAHLLPLMVGKGIIDCSQPTIRLVCANLGAESITLPPFTIIGSLEAHANSWETLQVNQSTIRQEDIQLPEDLRLDCPQLSIEQKAKLTRLLTEFASLFRKNSLGYGNASRVRHAINTGDEPPIN
jgi:hypothetical protein